MPRPPAMSGVERYTMQLKIKRLDAGAHAPRYATEGAAAADFSVPDAASYEIPVGSTAMVSTGWAAEVPKDHVLLMFSRSGHGAKHGIRLANCVGVIDPDYRGPLMSAIRNDGTTGGQPFELNAGDRFVQALLLEAKQMEFIEVDELPETSRGQGGFGSTGVASGETTVPAQTMYCKGKNCGSADPRFHSAECHAEHQQQGTTVKPSRLTSTHTVAIMELSKGAYEEIREKLLAAGYQHVISKADHHQGEPEFIDMSGIGIVPSAAR